MALNIYIYELVTPEFILSSQVRIPCAPKPNGVIFIYFFLLFLHPLAHTQLSLSLVSDAINLLDSLLVFSGISLQISF